MNSLKSVLLASDLTIASLTTIFVVIFFVCFMVCIWWVMKKKKTIKELFQAIKHGIYKFFDSIYNVCTQNKPVQTVYSDKSLNYSGTEFLPKPSKAPTEKYTFEFVGWDKNGVDVNGNFVVKAIYLQRVTKCYINVYDDDRQTLLRTVVVEYGAGLNLSDLKPQKADTKEFSYEFLGWDKDITSFYKNDNVYAVYKAVARKYTYSFLDDDGVTVISQGSAVYGTPIICPADPKKQSNDRDIYDFVGWRYYTDGMILTKNCTFFAMYEKRNVDVNTQKASSIIKPDGTIIRSKKAQQIQDSVVVKPVILPTDEVEDEPSKGSVVSQLDEAKNEFEENQAENEIQDAEQSEIVGGTKIKIIESNDDEVHQKIQLIPSRGTSQETAENSKTSSSNSNNASQSYNKNGIRINRNK